MADNKNLEKKEVAKKDKKDGLLQKISKFFREYKSELKKISWPTFPEVIKNSIVTIIVVVIVGLFIWLADTALTFGRDSLLSIGANKADTNVEDEVDLKEMFGIETTVMSTSDIFSGSDLSEASITDMYPNKEYYVMVVNGVVQPDSAASSAEAIETAANEYANKLFSDYLAGSAQDTTADTVSSETDAAVTGSASDAE